MIKSFKHVRKDKLKFKYDIEFKKISNLPNDLIGKVVVVKWDRGGKHKGDTKEYRVLKKKEDVVLVDSLSPPSTTSPTKSTSNEQIPPNKSTNSVSDPQSPNTSISTTTSTTTITSPTSPTSVQKDSLTRKQAKMLLETGMDGSVLAGGNGYIVMNDRISFSVTLYHHHSSKDLSNSPPSYDQKLLNLSLQFFKQNTLINVGSINLDLALHFEDNGKTVLQLPFPSCTSNVPTLHILLRSKQKLDLKSLVKSSSKHEVIGPSQQLQILKDEFENNDSVGNLSRNNTNESLNTTSSFDNTEDLEDPSVYEKEALQKRSDIEQLQQTISKMEQSIEEYRNIVQSKDKEILNMVRKIEGCQEKVMEYEESAHRAKVMEDFAKRNMLKVQLEFMNFKDSVLHNTSPKTRSPHNHQSPPHLYHSRSQSLNPQSLFGSINNNNNNNNNNSIYQLKNVESPERIIKLPEKPLSAPSSPSPTTSSPPLPSQIIETVPVHNQDEHHNSDPHESNPFKQLLKEEIEKFDKERAELKQEIQTKTTLMMEKEEEHQQQTKSRDMQYNNEKEHLTKELAKKDEKIMKIRESLEKVMKENNELLMKVHNEEQQQTSTTSTYGKQSITNTKESLFFNPMVAWAFALFCFFMFYLKTQEECK